MQNEIDRENNSYPTVTVSHKDQHSHSNHLYATVLQPCKKSLLTKLGENPPGPITYRFNLSLNIKQNYKTLVYLLLYSTQRHISKEKPMKTTHHNITLNFEQDGTGPAIVFIHDGPDNQSISDPRFAALAKAGFRIIVTNLRGLARGGEATVDDLTGDAVTLLNYLGLGRAVIFGIGRGGCVLLNLLEKHPARIAASSLVIPPAMAASLHRFAGRNGLLETLRSESAAPLLRELFSAVPTPPTPTLTELPALRAWLDQIAKQPQQSGKSAPALLADLHLPLLLIDTPTTPAGRRWRHRLGSRLRAFNGSLLALLDLLVPNESEEFDKEAFGKSH